MQVTGAWSLGQEDPLKEGMAAHSSIPACRIPGRLTAHGAAELDMTEATEHARTGLPKLLPLFSKMRKLRTSSEFIN